MSGSWTPPESAASASLTRPSPDPRARLRLFCFPYGGGGASIYHTWPADLPPEIEVRGVKLPGREGRFLEPPATRLLPLVRALADALRPTLDVPFAFFGHSLGALVSFELTRELRRRGDRLPLQLIASGRSAPQLPLSFDPIHQLSDARFVEEVRRFNGMPEEVLRNDDLMELVLPALRADFALHETYEYAAEAPLSIPITAFAGLEDGEFPHDGVAAWREQTTGAFRIRSFPGDHFFIHSAREQVVRAVADELAWALSA